MGSPLRDIPGAGTGRRRNDPLTSRPPERSVIRPAQPKAILGTRRRRAFGSRMEIDPVNLVIALAFVLLAVAGAFWVWNQNQVDVSAEGVEEGDVLTPQEAVGLEIAIDVSPTTRLNASTVYFDGDDVTDSALVETTDDGFLFKAPPGQGLPDGEHRLEVEVPRAVTGTAHWDLEFEVRRPG